MIQSKVDFEGSEYLVGFSTPLKNIGQIESFPKVGVKITNIWKHHPGMAC